MSRYRRALMPQPLRRPCSGLLWGGVGVIADGSQKLLGGSVEKGCVQRAHSSLRTGPYIGGLGSWCTGGIRRPSGNRA